MLNVFSQRSFQLTFCPTGFYFIWCSKFTIFSFFFFSFSSLLISYVDLVNCHMVIA